MPSAPRRHRWRLLAGPLTAALALPGCADPSAAIGFDEQAPDARLRAIRRAASDNDHSATPDLIRALESDDPAERLLAIRTLEKLTGQTLGYDHAAPIEERRTATRRWADWYASRGANPAPR